eukprot:336805-Pelagomonas_calceolata.AAC.1
MRVAGRLLNPLSQIRHPDVGMIALSPRSQLGKPGTYVSNYTESTELFSSVLSDDIPALEL